MNSTRLSRLEQSLEPQLFIGLSPLKGVHSYRDQHYSRHSPCHWLTSHKTIINQGMNNSVMFQLSLGVSLSQFLIRKSVGKLSISILFLVESFFLTKFMYLLKVVLTPKLNSFSSYFNISLYFCKMEQQ